MPNTVRAPIRSISEASTSPHDGIRSTARCRIAKRVIISAWSPTPSANALLARWLAPYEPVPELPADVDPPRLQRVPARSVSRRARGDRREADQAGRYPGARRAPDRAPAGSCTACPEGSIAFGNGADAIIGYVSAPPSCVPATRSHRLAVVSDLSYPMPSSRGRHAGARRVRDGAMDLDAIAERIGPRTRLVWVCTPNNPTGAPSAGSLSAFIDAVPDEVLVVVDEAYYEYCRRRRDQLDTIDDYVRSAAERRRAADVLKAVRAGGAARRLSGRATGGSRRDRAGAGTTTTSPRWRRRRPGQPGQPRGGRPAARGQPGRADSAAGRAVRARLAQRPVAGEFPRGRCRRRRCRVARLREVGIATRSLSGLGAPSLLRVTVGSPEQSERLLEALGPRASGTITDTAG